MVTIAYFQKAKQVGWVVLTTILDRFRSCSW